MYIELSIDQSWKLPIIYDHNFSDWSRFSVISRVDLCNNAKDIYSCHL